MGKMSYEDPRSRFTSLFNQDTKAQLLKRALFISLQLNARAKEN